VLFRSSAAARIDTPSGVSAFNPSIAVGSGGVVGVSYYDFRNNTAAAGVPVDVWFTHCHAACTAPSSWSETHVTGPYEMENAPVSRGYFLGDYQGMATSGSDFELLLSVPGSTPNSADARFVRMTP